MVVEACDNDNTAKFIIEEYKTLRELIPDHFLLGFMDTVCGGVGEESERILIFHELLCREWLAEFSPLARDPNTTPFSSIFVSYLKALRSSVDEITGRDKPSAHKIERTKATYEDEEQIPFW